MVSEFHRRYHRLLVTLQVDHLSNYRDLTCLDFLTFRIKSLFQDSQILEEACDSENIPSLSTLLQAIHTEMTTSNHHIKQRHVNPAQTESDMKVALYYMTRMHLCHPSARATIVDSMHRLFLSALIVARKYMHDDNIKSAVWSRLTQSLPRPRYQMKSMTSPYETCEGHLNYIPAIDFSMWSGYSVPEVVRMEVDFLKLLDWECFIDLKHYSTWLRDFDKEYHALTSKPIWSSSHSVGQSPASFDEMFESVLHGYEDQLLSTSSEQIGQAHKKRSRHSAVMQQVSLLSRPLNARSQSSCSSCCLPIKTRTRVMSVASRGVRFTPCSTNDFSQRSKTYAHQARPRTWPGVSETTVSKHDELMDLDISDIIAMLAPSEVDAERVELMQSTSVLPEEKKDYRFTPRQTLISDQFMGSPERDIREDLSQMPESTSFLDLLGMYRVMKGSPTTPPTYSQ